MRERTMSYTMETNCDESGNEFYEIIDDGGEIVTTFTDEDDAQDFIATH